MNDLMTKSFLNYVELKKQCHLDIESDKDIEKGEVIISSPKDEANMSEFFLEVDAIRFEMEGITSLLSDLQCLNEETKSTHSGKVLHGLRDRMDSDMVSVLRKAQIVKAKLQVLDKSNTNNHPLLAFDRTRVLVTNGLREKLRDIMGDFQSLRDKILCDHKEYLRRRYYNATGEVPSEEVIEKLVWGGGKIEVFEGVGAEVCLENRERHKAVMGIQRSLDNLHQVFLDMAVLVETQGEKIDDIEYNVTNARSFVSGGTNSLFYAKQMKKGGKKWVYWVWAVGIIILLVCFIAMISS